MQRTKVTWLWTFASVLFCMVLALEFSFDLSGETDLYWLAIGLDCAVVLGFIAYVVRCGYVARGNLRAFVQKERVDLILLILILPALFAPRLAAAMVIGRCLVGAGVNMLYTPLGRRLIANLNLRPSQTLSLSFIGIIFVGTVLLMFPAATKDGNGTAFLEALFTATSAACVVGLSVLDIGTYFSFFGQGVILLIIQVGGLGIMVMAASFAVMMGSRLQSRTHSRLGELFDVSTPEGVKNLVKAVAFSTLTAEIFGAFFLFLAISDAIPDVFECLWWSIFHSVSAFCNAGFSLTSNSLVGFAEDAYVCGIIMILITVGGIGFFVISDLANPSVYEVKKISAIWQRLQIQTKVALVATLVLNVFGLLFFLFLEYDGALAGLSVPGKILASLFQSVTLRTAGFATVPHGMLGPGTVLFMMVWMYIGANPGSTGGGIKTTTAAVAIMAMRAMLLGREDVELFGRRILFSSPSRLS
jgi:trk system potassium uptake protein TrkH